MSGRQTFKAAHSSIFQKKAVWKQGLVHGFGALAPTDELYPWKTGWGKILVAVAMTSESEGCSLLVELPPPLLSPEFNALHAIPCPMHMPFRRLAVCTIMAR